MSCVVLEGLVKPTILLTDPAVGIVLCFVQVRSELPIKPVAPVTPLMLLRVNKLVVKLQLLDKH